MGEALLFTFWDWLLLFSFIYNHQNHRLASFGLQRFVGKFNFIIVSFGYQLPAEVNVLSFPIRFQYRYERFYNASAEPLVIYQSVFTREDVGSF